MLKVAAGGASGSLNYQGTWNASTNTPTLQSGIGTKGYYYLVSVAGTTNLDGITDWQVNDWAVFNGSVWQKVDNSEAVVSVNGQTGAVVLDAVDVGATPNTAYVLASGLLSGGGQLTGNVTVSLDNVPVANVPGAVPNTVYIIAGNNLDGGGPLTGNVTIDLNNIPAGNVTGLGTMAYQNANAVTITGGTATGLTNVETNFVQFDTAAAENSALGKMYWDDGDGVPAVGLKGGLVTLQIGTQEYARVYNDSGTTLTKGQAVYISGAQGNRVAVKLARADVEATSFGTIGLVAETMTSGAEGFIIVSGALYKLNTLGLVAGATVYLSPTTAGALTTTKPQAPDQLVVVGWVERVDNNVGSIYVKIDNGYEIDELHDVRITSPVANNSVLIYSTVLNVWENKAPADARTALGLGTIATQNANNVTITGGTIDNTTITNGSASFSGLVTVNNVKTTLLSGYLYGNNGSGNVTASTTIPVADVTGAVPNTRSINTGTGLTGGGDLSADRTLSVVANTTQQLVGVQNNGVDVATRQIINFVPGAGITLAGADDTTRSNVTISVTTPLPSPGTSGNVLTSTGSAWVSNALPATGISLTDDTTSNSTRYITMTANTSGQITTENVSSTKLYFNPSTGQLSSSLFSAENGIVINKNNVSSNVTIGSGYNAMSAGNVTVANNVTVTVASGSRWVVL